MKILAAILVVLTLSVGAANAQTTAFNYQGFLKDGAAPASGNYAISISLWDAETGGVFLNSNTYPSVPVVNGVFAVELDFGEGVFSAGATRFIEIAVRPSGSGGGYTTLTPRSRIKSVPYSIQSLNSAKLGGIAANQYVTTTGGGADFIQNSTSQQTGNFNISGNGTANILSAAAQFDLAGQRILSAPATSLFVGKNAGISNMGAKNSFYGSNAGGGNVFGSDNSFFGASAGYNNLASYNSFFGKDAGAVNSDGSQNAFFGYRAGFKNTVSSSNSFFGYASGFNNTVGVGNTFFGDSAGFDTTSGSSNVFVGVNAGGINAAGSGNTVIGNNANLGATNLTNATAIGSRATAAANNSLVLGSINGVNGAVADTNVGIGTTSPSSTLTVRSKRNTSLDNTAGFVNTAIGPNSSHIHFGVTGDWYIRSAANGGKVIIQDTGGNVGIGTASPGFKLDVVGRMRLNQEVGNLPGMWLATSVDGDRGFVGIKDASNFGFFGNGGGGWSLTTNVTTGTTSIGSLGLGGATPLCRNASNEISLCSSSLKYKRNVSEFSQGMSLINQLRPISFDWKDGGMRDLGLGAEDVAATEPLLVTYNKDGQIEGVKYDRIGVVLVNAVKEQQAQIESQQKLIETQQRQIDAMKRIICLTNKDADLCKE
ncbi:MAG: tail fiber domain-containing protein [Chloracidobacterium sp.]|nr:tail fiber domain-containing protein [Chloracidobacterium sp.]